MHTYFSFLSLLGFLLPAVTSATPLESDGQDMVNHLVSRTSPAICGESNGNTICPAGFCCNVHNICGNTTDDCGGGCQSGYNGPGKSCINMSEGGICGPSFGGSICPGQCCQKTTGYCGITSDFCSDPINCYLGYGICDSQSTPAGPSTADAPRPLIGNVSYDNDIYHCVQNKVVALSYDAGPFYYTSQLLDILKSYNFKATFFITGNNMGKGEIDTTGQYHTVIQRMIAEGHQVASNTWSGYSLNKLSSSVSKSQMVKNEIAFNNIIGKWPTYMRPPYSECNAASGCKALMKYLGYHVIYFDLDTKDKLNPTPSQIQQSKNIVKAALDNKAATNYLSVQQDIIQQSVANLSSYFFDAIKARGWKGVSVGECLGDPEVNWYRSMSQTTSTGTFKSSTTTKHTSTSAAFTSGSSTTTKRPSVSTSTKKSTTTSALTKRLI